MGTRHLIEVKYKGITRIAQYGQWDGYLSEQGAKILKFLKKNAHKKKWLKALERCQFFTSDKQIEEMYPNIDESPENIPPYLHRDTGSKILDIVLESSGDIYLVDSRGAGGVAYWYTIDMDNNAFDVRNRGSLCVSLKLDKLPNEKQFIDMDVY